jgi:hypothetical protein
MEGWGDHRFAGSIVAGSINGAMGGRKMAAGAFQHAKAPADCDRRALAGIG